LPYLRGPDGMAPVIHRTFNKADCIPGAHRDTPVAGNAHPGIDMDLFTFLPEHPVWTTINTSSAKHALVTVHADAVSERDAPDAHYCALPMIGSPARGMVMSPTPGSKVRIAASSLDM